MPRVTASVPAAAAALLVLSCAAPPQTQQPPSGAVREMAPSPEAISWCDRYSYELYSRCKDYAKRIRSDPKLEWKMFQQSNAPIAVKKAAVEAREYYGSTQLLTDSGLRIAAENNIMPQFPPMNARGVDLAKSACGAGVNNFVHDVVNPRELILDQCYRDARGPSR